ncbi:MmcB family DNA repair protein [Sphingomonas sp. ASV193]|uniref:MmcB family DNA repair protein n=1 Tax=Sphingomonas sp. ASV193 TaxID=3144405 RepID=UPI0032E8F6D0
MATAPAPPNPIPDCFADAPPIAGEVARGVTRLLCRQDLFAICEVPLPNGRRADMMAIDGKGQLTIVEIKVSRADLVGDGKWTDYLDYCDRFYWAVPPHLAPILDEERFLPAAAGLLVADRYDAALVRDAAHRPLAPARRKAELLRFARRAARRLSAQIDPTLGFDR